MSLLKTQTFNMIVLCLMLSFGSAKVMAKEFNWKQNVNAGESLDLETDIGSIELSTHDQNEIIVLVRNEGENADQFSVSADYSNNSVSIKGEMERKRDWNRRHEVKFLITTPKQFNVNLKTRGGSIDVSSLSGNVKVKTSGGSLSFKDITGPVNGKTSGGSINANGVVGDVEVKTSGGFIQVDKVDGKIYAKTSGGSIKVSEVSGIVEAKTSGGSIAVDKANQGVNAATSGGSVKVSFSGQPKEDCVLKTSAGSVNVAFAEQVGFDIHASANAGKIYSDFEVEGSKQSKRKMKGTVNGGGPKLTLKTSAGSIKIEKL